eukprot:CAMPEP_0194759874 /NCGR_PEP_ID=MMETSP0323_2-20130528/12858_1 /TAXON_ID=2866 ORGANISM="Crypthecodinium cohnii, Strain Seligo" /NCGR_SAMPLE_ID=MMETSP0323_2 /ASSEMBLY_ACC=CAM_ASM_000346 /LENGTH=109 /DNA_ID=CAMNT_0039680833 /DNA_START=22 /DNA_END=348 /DNA_ORIENTATION=+
MTPASLTCVTCLKSLLRPLQLLQFPHRRQLLPLRPRHHLLALPAYNPGPYLPQRRHRQQQHQQQQQQQQQQQHNQQKLQQTQQKQQHQQRHPGHQRRLRPARPVPLRDW